MNKEVFIISGLKEEGYSAFKERIFGITNEYKNNLGIGAIKFTITEKPPPSISIIPFQKDKIAVLSIYHKGEINTEPKVKIEGVTGHYAVEEALVVSYDKTWEDGEITPGVCLLTLFSKKLSIDYDTFIDRWHNGHSPLSLKIHPLWHYNRNVVNRELSTSEVWYDGIVEEHVKKSSDLLNPFKFFGNPLIIIPRMIAVYTDVKSFIEYSTIKSYLVQEYFVKS